MLTKLAKVCLVAALAVSLGLHWVFLQTVAWAGMVATYSQTMPLKEALARTFDGKHPCDVCVLVREGQRSEKQKEAQLPLLKLDLVCAPARFVLLPPPTVAEFADALPIPQHLPLAPPVPPPRAA